MIIAVWKARAQKILNLIKAIYTLLMNDEHCRMTSAHLVLWSSYFWASGEISLIQWFAVISMGALLNGFDWRIWLVRHLPSEFRLSFRKIFRFV
jgi:hypothetical protein